MMLKLERTVVLVVAVDDQQELMAEDWVLLDKEITVPELETLALAVVVVVLDQLALILLIIPEVTVAPAYSG
jgi:hypothetical protein